MKNSKWLLVLGVWVSQAAFASTHIPLEHFNQIDLKGAMQVQIDAGHGSPSIDIDAPIAQLKGIKLDVKAGQLSLVQTNSYRRLTPTHITIHAPELRALRVQGSNGVKVQHLRTSQFNLSLNNHGNIEIDGVIGLQNLVAQGSGYVKIYWLNTSSLNLYGAGQIQLLLGGKVSDLHINATDNASINTRYMLATHAHIRASDCARVDVSVSQVLNAQAAGNSTIYYYQKPAFLGQHMYERGSVLNVAGEPTVN